MTNFLKNWNFSTVTKFLKQHGFTHCRTRGSHFHYKKQYKGKTFVVTVQSHGGKPIPVGTMTSIVRQSGVSKKLWIEFGDKKKKR